MKIDIDKEAGGKGKCVVKGCDGSPDYFPVVEIYPPDICGDFKVAPAQLHVSLEVCECHALTLRLEDIMSDEMYASIEHALKSNGKVLPDRSKTKLIFRKKEPVQ